MIEKIAKNRFLADLKFAVIAVISTSNYMFIGEICTSKHMFGRAIWDKLPGSISKISKIMRVIYPKNRPNQTCGYWLITPNQQTLCIETNIF